jgi:hypothetical protein
MQPLLVTFQQACVVDPQIVLLGQKPSVAWVVALSVKVLRCRHPQASRFLHSWPSSSFWTSWAFLKAQEISADAADAADPVVLHLQQQIAPSPWAAYCPHSLAASCPPFADLPPNKNAQ